MTVFAQLPSGTTVGGLTFDTQGNLFATDRVSRVFRITPAGEITTIAGAGSTGFDGDNGPATEARLSGPSGLAVDAAGIVYIADLNNHRIRRISADGIITTFAGNGRSGFAGDGGAATEASLSAPNSLALDGKGRLYVSDGNNRRIRVIGADGIMRTFAGNGTIGFSGDGGAPTAARLGLPGALAFAGATLYFTDATRIRMVRDNRISTIAGAATNGFLGEGTAANASLLANPVGLAWDAERLLLYVADTENDRIRSITAADASPLIRTVAGSSRLTGDGGPAEKAVLSKPNAVVLDQQGNIYIADARNHAVRKIAPDGTIQTIAGTGDPRTGAVQEGVASRLRLNNPPFLAVDAQANLYIGETALVLRLSPTGQLTRFAGNLATGDSGDGGQAVNAAFRTLGGLAVDSLGRLYVSDLGADRVRRIGTDGRISTFAGTGRVGNDGDGGVAELATLTDPRGVAIDSKNNVCISGPRIRKISPDGVITTAASGYCGVATDIVVDTADNVYAVQSCNYTSVLTGNTLTRIAGIATAGFSGDQGPALLAAFDGPAIST